MMIRRRNTQDQQRVSAPNVKVACKGPCASPILCAPSPHPKLHLTLTLTPADVRFGDAWLWPQSFGREHRRERGRGHVGSQCAFVTVSRELSEERSRWQAGGRPSPPLREVAFSARTVWRGSTPVIKRTVVVRPSTPRCAVVRPSAVRTRACNTESQVRLLRCRLGGRLLAPQLHVNVG